MVPDNWSCTVMIWLILAWGEGVRGFVRRDGYSYRGRVRDYRERLEGATGVWLDAHTSRARKICAIGIKCSRYVTMHGFALNVNTDLNYFNYINPCGFVDKGVTSISKEVGAEVPVAEVKAVVKKYFEELFGMDFYMF